MGMGQGAQDSRKEYIHVITCSVDSITLTDRNDAPNELAKSMAEISSGGSYPTGSSILWAEQEQHPMSYLSRTDTEFPHNLEVYARRWSLLCSFAARLP